LLAGVLHLVARLPLSAAHRIGQLLGWAMLKVPNKQRRNALINIRACFPGMDEPAARVFLRRSLLEYGKTYLEIAYLWLQPAERVLGEIREVRGLGLLKRQDGRGVIVLSPHLGAWELAGLYLSSLGPTTTLYKPQPVLDGLIARARARCGAVVVPITAQGIRQLLHALRRGELIGALPDQEPKADRGAVFAPFFGVPAYTMLLVSRMARKTGARVVFLIAERLPRGRGYRMHCLEAPEGIDSEADLVAATALNRGVEACIRICPEQYIWPYKRFRTRPEGLERLYTGPL
jgi:KDO2-lipid IV(A) lauroyltransferase